MMGLDMYLVGTKHEEGRFAEPGPRPQLDGFPVRATELDLGYWRKHPDLHGYIVNTFADGKDECQRIYLSSSMLRKIADAIEDGGLPHTEGFFFGSSEVYEETKAHDASLFRRVADWLAEKTWQYAVYYQASW
jgi:hypothetical protein